MRKKTSLLLFLLIISNDVVFGKHKNKAQIQKNFHKKGSEHIGRAKRSLNENSRNNNIQTLHFDSNDPVHKITKKRIYYDPKMEDHPPFWGNRGRRESSEVIDEVKIPLNRLVNTGGYKLTPPFGTKQEIEEESSPFWGNRGRRESEENDQSNDIDWSDRNRRQEDEPFWGTRGRREDEPFWGTRGRREDEPFWGTRGRREDEPFWGNRGRRENYFFRHDDSTPFWGNRGRREETMEPFWGSRGKKKENKYHIRKEENEPFWGNRGRRESDLLLEAINNAQDNIYEYERQRRRDNPLSFWSNRGRDSKIRYLFTGPARNRMHYNSITTVKDANREIVVDPSHQNTVSDDRIFVEEPHYIVVERSSRSSAENDPFIITRGKKYSNFDVAKAVRDRRGALEEIVKSVRNDPYYIARGKKDFYFQFDNYNISHDELLKAKELVCATVDLLMMKNHDNNTKRDVDNINERDRRTILKKIALQLQMDPYFVSRGKKSSISDVNEENLEKFVNQVFGMCLELK